MNPFRRRVRKLRFFVQATLVTLIISAAVFVGLAQLALPWLARNPQRIEGWLSDRLGRSVQIGHTEGRWTRAGPILMLDDLRIGAGSAGEAGITLPHAELALNLYAAFERNRAWNEFRLVGLDLGLTRNASGAWQLSGVDAGLGSNGDGNAMGALGAIVFVDMKLSIVDDSRKLALDLVVPELRVINLGSTTRILGQLKTRADQALPLSVVANIDADKSGRLYVGGKGIDLAALLHGQANNGVELVSATGDLELWGAWSEARVDDVRLKMDLQQAILGTTSDLDAGAGTVVRPRTALDRIGLSARWLRRTDGWTFDLADASTTRQGVSSAPARLVFEHREGEPGSNHLAANSLDVGSIGALAMLSGAVPAGLRRWLYNGNPGGLLRAIDLRWSSDSDFDVDARLDQFASRSSGGIPGIESLSARLRGDAGSFLLEVPTQPTRVELPKVFRKPFVLTAFGGDLAAWRDGAEWQLQTAGFVVDSADFSVLARGGAQLQGDGTRPALDLYAVVSRADVEAAKLFWPVNTMPPNTVKWLDRALVAGAVQGRAIVRGDLDNWPFSGQDGRFEARADLQGLQLAYLDDWPSGENLDVTARFINNGMLATAINGTSMDVQIDRAEAAIPDFHDPQLALSVDAESEGKAMLSFLRATPVGEQREAYLAGLSIGGSGKSHVQMDIPLKHSEDFILDGKVELKDADLVESNWALSFRKANGQVRFTRSGVLAESLATSYEGFPVSLGIAIGGLARDPLNAFEASLTGVLPAATLFARAPDLAPALPSFPGQAQWQVGLALGADGGAASTRRELRVQSDLQGIAINLPAPLQKAADTALPFALTLDMPPAGQAFSATLGDIVQVRGRLPGPLVPLTARLDFGPAASADPLPASGVMIGGHVQTLDADGWIGLLAAGGTGNDLLRGIALDVDSIEMAGRNFSAIRIELTPDKETTTVHLSGESLDGEINVPNIDLRRRGITAQMKRVRWPDLAAGKEAEPAALSGIAPASIPPLHLWIGELQLGSANLGDTRLESYPTETGMRIDLLETQSPNLDMHAKGDWVGSAGDNQSHLDIDMTAKSLGSMLDAFGFAGIIEGGETLAHINATWPGAPSAFALANTTGSLEIRVDKGRILDVEPGAGGRLFGLLSLREIPRRLSLDFSDLFKSGMSFNSIKGSFDLTGGNATTDDLNINSPAADITISGRTGLRSKDYDQEMVVTPRAGVALPVVGALAGGPVGAAAGLVVQTLIGKKINQVARSRYKVTGSWEKPVIALIGRETPKPAAAPLPIDPPATDETPAGAADAPVTPAPGPSEVPAAERSNPVPNPSENGQAVTPSMQQDESDTTAPVVTKPDPAKE